MNTTNWLAVVLASLVAGVVIGTLRQDTTSPADESKALYRLQRDQNHQAIMLLREVCDEAENGCDGERIYDLAQKAAIILTISPENNQRWVPSE